jgi:transposase
LEQAGERLRARLNMLATLAPRWLRKATARELFDHYTERDEEARRAEGQEVRYAPAEAIGADGYRLLGARAQSAAPPWPIQVRAVEVIPRLALAVRLRGGTMRHPPGNTRAELVFRHPWFDG